MMGFGFGFGFMWMLLFWGGLIAVAIGLVSLLFPSAKGQSDDDKQASLSAEEILKARYARGELSSEEFQQMQHMLK